MTAADVPGGDAGRDLYGLDPGDFTAARNTLAKRLRAVGDKAEAALVAKLRRPPVTAWALNKVARTQPGVIDAVLDAGAGLRAATEEALGGNAATLRTAQAWERRALDAATSAAAAALTAGAQRAGDAARQRMAATLRAAMVDATVAVALRNGVLDDDRDAPGFGLDAFSPAAAGSAVRARAGTEAPSAGTEATAPGGPGHEAQATSGPDDTDGAGSEAPEVAEARASAAAKTAEAERAAEAEARSAALERAERRTAQLLADADEAERRAVAARDAAASAGADAERAVALAGWLDDEAEAAAARAAAARTAAEESAARLREAGR